MYLLDVYIRYLKYFCVLFVLFVFLFMLLASLRCYTSIFDGFIRQMAEVNLLSGLKNQVHRAGEVEAAQRAAFLCDKTSAVMISAAVAESIKPLLPPLTCKKR